ncbi:MAG TPA: hypothetical protein VGL38_12320 [bacterium]|jgi:hypothetical protein
MKSVLISLCMIAIVSSLCFGQACGSKCSAADKKAAGGCCAAATKASYTDARLMPECAPSQVHDFHRVLMPFVEARSNVEPSYIKDNARFLLAAAQPVLKSKACCPAFNQKTFRHGAKDLVKHCEQLQKLSLDKKVKDEAVLAQMKQVEDDFVVLSNSCQ